MAPGQAKILMYVNVARRQYKLLHRHFLVYRPWDEGGPIWGRPDPGTPDGILAIADCACELVLEALTELRLGKALSPGELMRVYNRVSVASQDFQEATVGVPPSDRARVRRSREILDDVEAETRALVARGGRPSRGP